MQENDERNDTMELAVDGPGSRVSAMAEGLVGSEILKIATDIRKLVAEGKEICNLTVGDFNPSHFRIPIFLEQGIEEALRRGETNYPPSDGVAALRQGVVDFYERWLGLRYSIDSVLVTGGSRPGIYTAYRALVDPGDSVIYPVPSWNNNHYCHLTAARGVPLLCHADTDFLPRASMLRDLVRGARLLAVNSPLNPTGTAFTADDLGEICDLVLEENARRGSGERPLYLMYDQVYWMLTFGDVEHVNPVSLRPEMAAYTVFIDGISKAFAATGIRVGWTVGPPDVTHRMASILGHIGAWAPRAEQLATARMLEESEQITSFHDAMKVGVQSRLDTLYNDITALRGEGFPVEAIPPMGAIYLTARFSFFGRRTPDGTTITTNEQIRLYLLDEAGIAVVPFQAFGLNEDTGWFRLSVGGVSVDEIENAIPRLRRALVELT